MDNLCQNFTPDWVALALVDRYFERLTRDDVVLEPSCGEGAFLRAIAGHISAVGVEIDPSVAAVARLETHREIIVGDFRSVTLSVQPTAIIGNPPFVAKVFDGFLDRSYLLLPEGGRAGFILPTYFFQTANRVSRYFDRWSISVDLLPRNAFHARMRTPLMFAVFAKDRERTLVGFALYTEAVALRRMAEPYRTLLASQSGSAWRSVCKLALHRLGGEAALSAIYAELERNRPTQTTWWREKIRQTLRVYKDFVPIDTGRYRLAA